MKNVKFAKGDQYSQIPRYQGKKEEPGTRWTLMGAEQSSNDYTYVQWMEREWKRGSEEGKVLIVLVFWIYFERRIGPGSPNSVERRYQMLY